MAGGKITEIAGGSIVTIAAGDLSLYAQHLNLAAADRVNWKGEDNGVNLGTDPKDPEEGNFDVTLSLNTDERTFVPLGIPAYDDKLENAFFYFNYTLLGAAVSSLNFRITDEAGRVLHNHSYLEPVVVTAWRIPEVRRALQMREPIITWDSLRVARPFLIEPPDHTQPGSYALLWDGFDMDDVYDSAALAGKTLTASIVAEKGSVSKREEIRFRVERDEVDWVDVRINKGQKRIDATLRLALTDGGAEGLDCNNPPSAPSGSMFTPSTLPVCDWDRIPAHAIAANGGRVPLQTRIRSFAELEAFALRGVQYHWGRNAEHAVAKNARVGGEAYEVFITPVNTPDNAMDDVALVFNTNGSWMRSGNPGTVDDPVSFIGNLVSREAVAYNAGYIRRSSRWSFDEPADEDVDFRFTAAHEIGHTILKAYGGTAYSYGHKGSVNVVLQTRKDEAPAAPATGEVDIMPYYPNSIPLREYDRYAAAEADVMGLVWLTKLKIENA